ncbi:histidine phosphatase family protein [Ramlibacter sp. 2FC]|uniref:histidine phosphatase family protein n=1 Tax=Ramlibacter sp. 2FC TaxID=2502188 RepID=UPI0010F85B61|nr:histidine phosphatase family protein [Ramlibacter sp. 2FC]
MTLWLIRHARPLVAPGVCYGALDVPAEPQDTRRAAERLAGALPPGLALRCSPRQRCQQLAGALTALRPDLACTTDPRLAEMDFGAWEGQRWEALGAAALAAWSADFAQHRPGGGESVQTFMRRVGAAWDEARAARLEGQALGWITHAGVIRAAGLLASGIACPERADQWPPDAPGYGQWRCLPATDLQPR